MPASIAKAISFAVLPTPAKTIRSGGHVEAGERLAEDAVVSDQCSRRVAIERRPDRRGDCGQGHVLGVEHAVAVLEVIHGSPVLEQEIEREATVRLAGLIGSLVGIFLGRGGARRRRELAISAAG